MKPNKYILLLLPLFAVCFLCPCYAQEEVDFTADRPGATTGPDVMPKKALNWETGMEYEWNRLGEENERTWNINNSLFRYGVTDFAELRFGISESYTYCPSGNYGGISDLTVGTKIKIFDGYKAIPKIALLGTLLIPGGKDHNYLPERIGGDFHLLFNNGICSWFSLGYDVGLTWVPNAREETFLGFNFSFQPTDKLACFIEEYNTFAEETSCMSEIGVSYMVHPRVQIDAYTDLNWKHLGKYNTVGIGVAWKIL